MADHVANFVAVEGEQEVIRKMMEAVQKEPCGLGSLDFQKVIPRPKALEILHGSYTKGCMDLYLTAINPRSGWSPWTKEDGRAFSVLMGKLRQTQELGAYDCALTREQITKSMERYQGSHGCNTLDDLLSLGKRAVENALNYGHITWYEWGYEHWGTPKNSLGYERFPASEQTGNQLRFLTEWTSAAPVIRTLSEQYPDLLFAYQSVKLSPGACFDERILRAGQEIGLGGVDQENTWQCDMESQDGSVCMVSI